MSFKIKRHNVTRVISWCLNFFLNFVIIRMNINWVPRTHNFPATTRCIARRAFRITIWTASAWRTPVPLCLTYPTGRAPWQRSLRSLVVEETWILGHVSPRMHARSQTLWTVVTPDPRRSTTNGCAASGGALAPELPRATRSPPEFKRIFSKITRI